MAVFYPAISNMALRHVAFCERHVALLGSHVALHVRHVSLHEQHVTLLILRQWNASLNYCYAIYNQPACRVYFPLHPARYEPVSTYLGPHSKRTHVPLVRHPPSLDIKANRNAPAIRRHCLAWEHQAK